MLYVRGMIALIYVDDALLFLPDQDNIYEIIKELEDTGILLDFEQDQYALLGVEVNTGKQSSKVTMTQGDLTKKFMKTLVMLDSNKNITPSEIMPLVTDTDGPPFD